MQYVALIAIVGKRRHFVKSTAHSCVIRIGYQWRRVRRNKRGGYYYQWWNTRVKITALRVKAGSVTMGGNNDR